MCLILQGNSKQKCARLCTTEAIVVTSLTDLAVIFLLESVTASNSQNDTNLE